MPGSTVEDSAELKVKNMTTKYHAKLYAQQLMQRHSVSNSEKLASTLLDAKVDLNPHQVAAALFAFNSPFSKGAILADEVGLGKTIEAGLLLSQKWSERKRRILIIGPANLRKQWSQEVEEKFYLPTIILEAKHYNRMVKRGVKQPFQQRAIIICSFQFAARHTDDLMITPWDLVVIDEAHRLRNVYRTDNVIGKALKGALQNVPKILLTATPLQNSLMELYGLVSLIDDLTFGDAKSFRSQYARLTSDEQLLELKDRLKPICYRTLRRQVLEYIRYTNRIPITQQFIPTDKEQVLYNHVSEYLQRPSINALPRGQRTLMMLVMRKLLASSTFAIAGALDSLIRKLERSLKEDTTLQLEFDEDKNLQRVAGDFEGFSEVAEEWADNGDSSKVLNNNAIEVVRNEIDELKMFRKLAVSISENAKGQALLSALEAGFKKAVELKGPRKALIFTESRLTQEYLHRLLSQNGFENRIVLFNGSNTDSLSKSIYEKWKIENAGSEKMSGSRAADIRAALVDCFRNQAEIMIATEAAAEGINLQFCSIVVNYDLPWNPQRIEQRIGRCHRYGQMHDVVVINFLNKNNAADQRVFEILSEKFRLFSGVFGASDEVLGAVESGIEFEKRIVEIYQTCRTQVDIEAAFKSLQCEMAEHIDEAVKDTRKKLLENFDAEVHDRLKVSFDETTEYISRYERLLWQVTKYELKAYATFDDGHLSFILKKPVSGLGVSLGEFHLTKKGLRGNRYRVGHPLAQWAISRASKRDLAGAEIIFNYTQWPQTAESLKPLVGRGGSVSIQKISLYGIDVQDHIIFGGITDAGLILETMTVERLFELPCRIKSSKSVSTSQSLNKLVQSLEADLMNRLKAQRAKWLADESQKLEKWAEDKVVAAEGQLSQVKVKVKMLKREMRSTTDPKDQHKIQSDIQDLDKSKRRLRQRIFEVEDEILAKRDNMIAEIGRKLRQSIRTEKLFTIRWRLI